jgi:maltose-binding protein MalE
MTDDLMGKVGVEPAQEFWARAGLGLLGPQQHSAGRRVPWSQPPKSKVDKLNFVVWTYGDIYARISKQFETDWGVKVDSTISSFNDHPTKLADDVRRRREDRRVAILALLLPELREPGPGRAARRHAGRQGIRRRLHALHQAGAMVNGKLMGLPYFATAWVWNYYSDMLEKLKIDKPFTTYEEFIEHCVKAKKDGVSRYPVLWVAGVGLEQLPGTWYQMTWNRGGTFFDKQGNHMLGAGSVARETLKWWANTFEKGLDIADPESLKVQFTTSAKAFGAGKNLYRGPNHHYGLNVANDPAQSPIAGKVKVLGSPGDGKTIADAHVYFLCTANRNKEWAWKLLQYLGGKTKGRQLHAGNQPRQGCDAGLRLSVGDEQ